MKIGIVQSIVNPTGGNNAVLKEMINTLKTMGHEIILYTFSKPSEEFSNITIKTKIPIRFPLLGIYQNFLMPNHNYDECDIIISTTHLNVKTKKPLIIYDQNNLGLEQSNSYVPIKYRHGFWKYYYLPYKKLNKFTPKNDNVRYVSNSFYSAMNLSKMINYMPTVLYPPVNLSEFFEKEKKLQVCMIGRISPEKNLEFAVKVLNKIPHSSIIFGNVTTTNIPYYEKLQKMCKSHVRIKANGSRQELKEILAESKVYLHTAEETFGISVIEAIASGCIPIIPNNSAHLETVCFDELRYVPNNQDDAVSKLTCALKGIYDDMLDRLKEHIKMFDVNYFQKSLSELVK